VPSVNALPHQVATAILIGIVIGVRIVVVTRPIESVAEAKAGTEPKSTPVKSMEAAAMKAATVETSTVKTAAVETATAVETTAAKAAPGRSRTRQYHGHRSDR
jgi:hypothetical protein